MAAKFIAEEGALKGLVLSLEDGDQWVIGRDPDACQLLIEDPSASRKHLICRATPQGIVVENLSEVNPVEVNEEKIKEPRLLQNGDAVKIGNGIFRFYSEPEAQLFEDALKDDAANDEEENPKPVDDSVKEPQPPKENALPSSNTSIKEPTMETTDKEQKSKGQAPEPPQSPPLPEAPPTPQTPPPPAQDTPITTEKPPENQHNDDMLTDEPGNNENPRHDSIFGEEPADKHAIAEINFGLLDTGRWLLKVISGPNNGAEFSMQTGNSYVIGTDPNACDIVFHDTSVSRQHSRVTISQEDVLMIEDLRSRNGTMVDGVPLKAKQPLSPNAVVTLGTTSFIIFDREGEMHTIISPFMPSIVKALQAETPKDEKKSDEHAEDANKNAPPTEQSLKAAETHHNSTIGALILIGIITGLFVIVGIGTSTLFRSEPVVVNAVIDTTKILDEALAPFPTVKYTFNPSTGQLLLVGHVLTTSDKNQLLYALQGMPFITSRDDSGVVIDEYVWRETDQVLEKNPDWKGISVMSATPGHFTVTGYLQTTAQAERLTEYLNANFPYPDLLENKVIVNQEVIASATSILQSKGFKAVIPKLDNGDLVLTGAVPAGKTEDLNAAIAAIKDIRGVRSVRNSTVSMAAEESIINISDKYDVTGISNQGGKISVIINGRILMKGDSLDGMTITNIQAHTVYLEKDGTKYRIEFSQ